MKKFFTFFAVMLLATTAWATIPSTDFSSPYSCAAADAILGNDAAVDAGKISLVDAETDYIGWADVGHEAFPDVVASWTIHSTVACYVTVTLDLGPKYPANATSNKHIFQVKILDSNEKELGYVEEGPAYTGDGTQEQDQTKALSGSILIPAAGDYKIELRNNKDWCKGSIKNVILTGNIIPDVTFAENAGAGYYCTANDAVLTGVTTSFYLDEESDPDCIMWKDNAYVRPATSYATWTINATRASLVQVTLDLGAKYDSNKHIYELQLLDVEGNILDTIAEGKIGGTEYTEYATTKTLDGYLVVPAAGIYTIKLIDNRAWAKGRVKKVILKYLDAPMPMYLKFASGITWADAGAKFCAYSFEGEKPSCISDFMELAENETEIYKTIVPANYAKIIFVRNSNTAEKPSTSVNKWNQTSDITREANKDFFIINGGSDQNYTGYWKKYNSALEDAYYLIGIVNGVEGWNEEDLTAARKFTADASAEVEDQMSVEAKLVSSDRIKAVYIENKEIKYWYPNSGEGWIIDGNHTGDPQTVYLSPGGHGGSGWLNTVLYVPDNSATSLSDVNASDQAVKRLENGQLVIIRGENAYTVTGVRIR